MAFPTRGSSETFSDGHSHGSTRKDNATRCARGIPFEGQTNADWQPASHDVRPVQGSSWFHYDPQLKAQYQVSPVFGTPDKPQVDLTEAVVSNVVEVNGDCGKYLNIASNRGSLLTTQWAARTAPKDSKGGPSKTWIRQAVGEPSNPCSRSYVWSDTAYHQEFLSTSS